MVQYDQRPTLARSRGAKDAPGEQTLTVEEGKEANVGPTLRLVLALGCSLAAAYPATSADGTPEPTSDRPYWRKNLFKRVLVDQKFLVTEWWPSDFRRPGFAMPLGAATLVAAAQRADASMGRTLERAGGAEVDRVAGGLTSAGNGPVVAALLGTTYLVSRWSGHDRLAEASSLSAEALIDAGIWIEVLKHASARVRPNHSEEGEFFRHGKPENGSFPSGHAMGAFAIATVFADRYRDKRWVPWVAYGGVTLIGTSRVALGRHFPTDVVVGGLLGNSIGRGVVARQGHDDLQRSEARWIGRLGPLVDPARKGYGVVYAHTW